jgi:hypothetical protein
MMVVPLADNMNHMNVHVSIDMVPREAIHTVSFGTEYSDFTGEEPPKKVKMMVNRTFRNRLQKYTDLRRVRKIVNIWELDGILKNYRSSTEEEDNDTESDSESEKASSSSESEAEEEDVPPPEDEEEVVSSEESEEEPEEKKPLEYAWYNCNADAYFIARTG